MYNMADEYYSQSNLMDYRLVSTVGFDKDDVKAVENLDNVTDVMPSYFADLVLKSNGNGGNGNVIRVTAAPKSYNNNKTLNTLNIKEGRLPEKRVKSLLNTAVSAAVIIKSATRLYLEVKAENPMHLIW